VEVKFRREVEWHLRYRFYEGFAYSLPERAKIKEIEDPELKEYCDGCYEIVTLTVDEALRTLDYLITIHKRRKDSGIISVEFKIS